MTDTDDDDDAPAAEFSSSTSFTLSSMLDLGLEQTEVFVLWDPCALGESIPLSLGLSSLRDLNGHLADAGEPDSAGV